MCKRYFPTTIPETLFSCVKRNPNRIAIDFLGKKYTYNELFDNSLLYARIINSCAKKTNTGTNNIALLMPNIPQFVFGYYGALTAGYTVVPINFSSIAKELKTMPVKNIKVTEEMVAQIVDSKPRVLIATDFFWPMLEQVKDALRDTVVILTGVQDCLPFPLSVLYPVKARKEGKWVKVKDESVFFLKDLAKEYAGFARTRIAHLRLDDVAQIQYTGGTTGVPKGAMLSHENVIANTWQCRKHLGSLIDDGETMLGVLPFFHIYGLTICMNITLLSLGGTLVLLPAFSPEHVARTIQKKKVTVFPGVNRMFQTISELPNIGKYDMSSLKLCCSGAGPLPIKVKEGFEKATGATLVEGYGLSEASPVVSLTLPTENKPGSIGRPLPLTQVKLVDIETGNEITGPFVDGEIVVRGPQVMVGYYHKEQETSDVLKDGWLRTGDIGRRDADGFLSITDRQKDMFTVCGENVFCKNIEDYIMQCPSVKKCVVIGVPDDKTGEAPIVFAVVDSKAGSEQNLNRHIENIPNKVMRPREIILVGAETFEQWEDILGKIKRRKIKDYYQTIGTIRIITKQ